LRRYLQLRGVDDSQVAPYMINPVPRESSRERRSQGRRSKERRTVERRGQERRCASRNRAGGSFIVRRRRILR
jgi:hypothetical protein